MICGLFLTIPLATIAQRTITGTVTDQSGLPLPGVRISVQNTYLRTYTDKEGLFKLEEVYGIVVLVAELSGFETTNLVVSEEISAVSLALFEDAQSLSEVLVHHVRADDHTPTTYTNLNTKEIKEANFGQDLPYLLKLTPSTVVTSDAGAGVGYTGIRIRGVDPTRTNVTINGIPINDSESHGVWWVNMPDFASSAGNIQVQRGVGTSNNGAAAFGASINITTEALNKKAYGEIDNSYGSFNTWRNTVKAGTGLIDGKFSMEARLSRISSEGYIDRATSDLKSYYLSGAWYGKKSNLKAFVFGGKEVTYQAWWGTPESVIKGDKAEIEAYADRNWIFGDDRENLLNSGRTYNYYTYENEVDNYAQDHYQLHFSHDFNRRTHLNIAGHYTRGRGYYEQFRKDDDFATYGFDPLIIGSDTITSTDLIRRRWLDNHFYGGIFAFKHTRDHLDVIFGGGANQYLGDHFGEVIWTEFASNSQIRDRYYENSSEKTEVNSYLKLNYRKGKTSIYLDLQFRNINYSFLGVDEVSGVLTDAYQTVNYSFLNPKAGVLYELNSRNSLYLSAAVANREPVRDDFRENTPANRPQREQLLDVESGFKHKGRKWFANANIYAMLYKNQLILTGQINDVGGYTRTNADESYRLGFELEGAAQVLDSLSLFGNLNLSSNKIVRFVEYIDNYDTYIQDTIVHSNTDLAFSPSSILTLGMRYAPVRGLSLILTGKYVGQQFLDNTSSPDRVLDAYFVSDLKINYTIPQKFMRDLTIGLAVNNLFNELYENNGYTWGYIYGGERTVENFYYPQAGRNFLVRVRIGL